MKMMAAVTSVPEVWFLIRKFYLRPIAWKSKYDFKCLIDFFEWKSFSFFLHLKNVCVWNVAFDRAGWGDKSSDPNDEED